MSANRFAYVFVVGGAGRISFGDALVTWETPMQVNEQQQYGLVERSADDYRSALASLLPVGPAWPTDANSVLQRFLGALAAEFARLDARAALLWAEVDPARTAELLADHERVVGLPDPCVTTVQTVAERRKALQGRLTSVGGQSKQFFINLASRLGYSVTIDEFTSAAQATAAGVLFSGDEWAHIWRVNVPTSVGVTPFRAGAGSAGEPLRAWSDEVIECQFNRYKPAHTRVLFAYTT